MTGAGIGARIRTAVHAATADAGPPGWLRPPPDADQRRRDVVVGALVALGGVLTVLLSRGAGVEMAHRPALAEELAWALAVSLPLCVRRRYPQTVLLVVALAFTGLQLRQVWETLASQIALFLAMFTVGAWARERSLSRWTRGVVVAAMFGWIVWAAATGAWDTALAQNRPQGPVPAKLAMALLTALVNVLYFGAAWAFGDLAWRSAGQRALLEQRNAELAVERDENARRAVLDERVRIARELHDVVAHHVSVMGVQAGAARVVLDADPQAARAALAGIEQSARHAVDEMRRLLGVLRAPHAGPGGGPDGTGAPGTAGGAGTGPDAGPPPSPPSPAPGLDGLADLVASATSTGLRVDFTVVGTPLPVPPGLSVSVYRIVQEALTNTVRHAGAGRVDVRLRYLAGPAAAVEAEVVDDGRAADVPVEGARRAGGRGLGLIGMRERAALHDGELETGPRPGGGYRVRVRFPLDGHRPIGAATSATTTTATVATAPRAAS